MGALKSMLSELETLVTLLHEDNITFDTFKNLFNLFVLVYQPEIKIQEDATVYYFNGYKVLVYTKNAIII